MLASTTQSTSRRLVILIATPHALKMLSQAQVVIRTAIQASEVQRECRRNSGHDGDSAVKVAPTARRFAVHEP
jgi:hypothetical protein